jgi:hypothetical protein
MDGGKRESISGHQIAFGYSRPVLIPPDYSKPFGIAVDCSDVAMGETLLQERDGLENPLCFLSRKQRKYSTLEKEALALLVAVHTFSVYFGSAPVKAYTNCRPLQYLERMAQRNAKLLRWRLELQQYNLDIVYRPGRKFLS